MKRLVVLAVLAAFVLGMAGTASAVDLEATGKFQFQANIMDNTDFLSAEDNGVREDDLNFWFRARAQFRFIANENLWGVLYTEYKTRVGSSDAAIGTGSSDRALGIKNVYLGFRYPGTEVYTQAGIWNVNLPGAAAGNMVLGDLDAGAVMVESPIVDAVSFNVGYIRAYDRNSTDTTQYRNAGDNAKDELDLFYAALPITVDGVSLKPYAMYGLIGQHSYDAVAGLEGLTTPGSTDFTKNVNAWWGGAAFELTMFDPIVFQADLVYGSVDADQKENDRDGFGMDASIAYNGLDFVKPKMVFAYTTGEDDDTDNGSERLPIVNDDWAFGSFYFGGSALTSADLSSTEQSGFWTLGLSLEDISFLDKLTHDVHFLYIKGTNDSDLIKEAAAGGLTNIEANGNFLTDEDQAFEVDFNTNYQIYDELAAVVEFGYINMDLDTDTWDSYNDLRDGKEDDAFKFAVGLLYNF